MSHRTSHHHRRWRSALIAGALACLLGPLATQAAAATRVFVVITAEGRIAEINPATGAEIGSFATSGFGVNPGLAFNGSELFYTDDSSTTVQVFSTTGTLLRQLPKPAGSRGAGLGVSSSSLFMVGYGGESILAISPINGAVQSSIVVDGATQALTYAGSRGTLFVRIGDTTIAEADLNGTIVNTFDAPVTLNGLGFSSSAERLYGSVDGMLYALDPDDGTVLPGYPVQIRDGQGNPRSASGGLAADEIGVNPSLVTRGTVFWKTHPRVIDGSFDGPRGVGSLLPIQICGLRLDQACEASLVLSLHGNGILKFAREATAATLNCKAFQNCPPEVLDVIKAGSDACAKLSRRFDYNTAGNALAQFNRSGEGRPIPFNPGPTQPHGCFQTRH
jgi:hypothetical protein